MTDLESEARSSTPGLSKIPILGNLFKNRTTQRNTNEILLFITPRIYRPDYEGNPTAGKVGNGTRMTTIIQPVPLGNPPSNSGVQTNTSATPLPSVGVPIVQPENQTRP